MGLPYQTIGLNKTSILYVVDEASRVTAQSEVLLTGWLPTGLPAGWFPVGVSATRRGAVPGGEGAVHGRAVRT
jgi:hypothetical protein